MMVVSNYWDKFSAFNPRPDAPSFLCYNETENLINSVLFGLIWGTHCNESEPRCALWPPGSCRTGCVWEHCNQQYSVQIINNKKYFFLFPTSITMALGYPHLITNLLCKPKYAKTLYADDLWHLKQCTWWWISYSSEHPIPCFSIPSALWILFLPLYFSLHLLLSFSQFESWTFI